MDQVEPSSGDIPKFIRRLMPAASDTELREATETFERYMGIVLRIHQRLKHEVVRRDSLHSGIRDRVDDVSRNV